MLFWMLWLNMLSSYTAPVTVQITVRVPATAKLFDFAAEKAKRAARRAS
jgi:hypothetical protein